LHYKSKGKRSGGMLSHGRWVNARDLKVGDELLSRSQSALHVLSLNSRNETTTVYNLTIADYHTYAVGMGETLVHNKAMSVPKTKITKKGISDAVKKNDVPSWAEGKRPFVGENGNAFAERLLNDKYGPGKWKKGPGTEYNIIRKWGDAAFENPK
jgi:hypothetical protein